MDSENATCLLFSLCNSYLSGSTPEAAAKVLAGAKLIALNKNIQDVRPKLHVIILKKTSNYLTQNQYGVATPGGAESMTHLVQAVLEQIQVG